MPAKPEIIPKIRTYADHCSASELLAMTSNRISGGNGVTSVSVISRIRQRTKKKIC